MFLLALTEVSARTANAQLANLVVVPAIQTELA